MHHQPLNWHSMHHPNSSTEGAPHNPQRTIAPQQDVSFQVLSSHKLLIWRGHNIHTTTYHDCPRCIYQPPKIRPSVVCRASPPSFLHLESWHGPWRSISTRLSKHSGKVVREEIDVDLHCTSAKFRRRGEKTSYFCQRITHRRLNGWKIVVVLNDRSCKGLLTE